MSIDLPARLAALETWLVEHAPDTVRSLSPGVGLPELETFERETGLTLPDDFQTLYRWHDGQADVEDLTPAGVFGLEFIPLAEVQSEWQRCARAMAAFQRTTGQVSHPEGHIREQFVNLGWLAFAKDSGGNFVGIDLDPGPSGVVGQVITFGRDEEHKYVLATSLAAFVDEFVRRLETERAAVLQPDEDGFQLVLLAASGELQDGYMVLADLFPGFGASPIA